jgi:hypothetical protein
MNNNNIRKIINTTIKEFINELIDPNAGSIYQPPGLDPSVVKLFEDTDELYQSSLNDEYWNEISNIFPNYNNPESEDNEKAIDFIIKKMKNKYPNNNWEKIENTMRKKINAGIT